RRRRIGGLCHRGGPNHQPVATPVTRLDVARAPGVVAERAAQLLNARGERIVGDRDAVPHLVEQARLGHYLRGALGPRRPPGRRLQRGGGARRELPLAAVARQLSASPVQAKRAERQLPLAGHASAPFRISRKFPGTLPGLPGPSPRDFSHAVATAAIRRRSPMKPRHFSLLAAIAVVGMAPPAFADVITDWNDKAVEFGVKRSMLPPPAERVIAMTQVAMFDAVNSIERKYTPYLVQFPAEAGTSREAAAAAAAGTVLAGINPQAKDEMTAALASYLAAMPDSPAKPAGIKLGEAVAAKVLEARQNDGAAAPDSYRPRTTAGVYVPTAPTATPQWAGVKPFALTSTSQFRPSAPIALTSARWTADYNEMKEVGSLASAKRTAKQTEDS